MCHHDAVTGTAKAFVVENYFEMLSNGTKLMDSVSEAIVSKVLNTSAHVNPTKGDNSVVIMSSSYNASIIRIEDFKWSQNNDTSGWKCQQSGSDAFIATSNLKPFSISASKISKCKTSEELIPSGPFSVKTKNYELRFDSFQWMYEMVENGNVRKLAHSMKRYGIVLC